MEKFKVLPEHGIYLDGVHHEKGSTVRITKGAALSAFLHFGQVSKVSSKEKDPEDEIKEADQKARDAENKDHDLKDGGKKADIPKDAPKKIISRS